MRCTAATLGERSTLDMAGPTAIDADVLTGDVFRIVGDQEGHGLGDFGYRADVP